MAAENPNVVILPSPGMGHLIPLVELAKRLVNRHGLTVTFIIVSDGPPNTALNSVLDSIHSSVKSVFLPPADLTDLSEDARPETRIHLTLARSTPALRHLLRSLTAADGGGAPSALIVDLFGTDAFDVAREFDIPPYLFFPSTANLLLLFLHMPKLDETVPCEYRDLTDPVKVPGCVPIPPSELPDPMQDRTNDGYRWILHGAKRFNLAEGILVNTFKELELNATKALQEPGQETPPVYPVGPLVKMENDKSLSDGSECLKWLDNQPSGSVLYVSFGSGGTLSHDQLTQLALGLEQSGHRFLWVIRAPNNLAASSLFDPHGQTDPLTFLPAGFLDRNGKTGLVVPSWAPQVEILNHRSTGGFMSHCGWNSTLESVVNGVPLIAWPLYAEQRMNAVMLVEEIKVALRPMDGGDGLIRKEEIERVVKRLMEEEDGRRVKDRMKGLKEAADRVLADDGSSTKSLTELAQRWISNPINRSKPV